MPLSLKQSITNNASDLSVLQSSFDVLTINVSEAVAFHHNIPRLREAQSELKK